jgi:acetyltransferase-like isoleucine patch superfamily enzyme
MNMNRVFIYKLLRKISFETSKLRGRILFNKKVFIEKNVQIPYPETVIIKGNCTIKSNVQIKTCKNSNIVLNDNTMICSYTTLETAGGYIEIGKNIIIGEFSTIQGQGGVVLEDNVLLASHVHFISNHHQYTNVNQSIKDQPNISGKILVKENTWIGINVVILSGVTIGKNCVIGTGSIVKHDIPDYSVAVGNPAKVVKFYDFNSNKWVAKI